MDWKWLFIYPDLHVASLNRLVVPTGAPISFELTSASVMNSFFVPQLGSMIYAMPGMATRLNLLVDRPGTTPGLSAQFSGDGFADMRFDVVALDQQGFEDWVRTTRSGGGKLDDQSYRQLAAAQRGGGADRLSATSRPDCSSAWRWPDRPAFETADADAKGLLRAACEELTCWANLPGTPFRGISRSPWPQPALSSSSSLRSSRSSSRRAGFPPSGANGSPASTTSGSA